MGVSTPQAIVSDGVEVRNKAFAQLEAWLSGSPFLAGNEVSIADLAAVCEVTMHSLVAFDLSPYPQVQAWVARLFEIPAVTEGHQGLEAFKTMLAAKQRETQEKVEA